MKIVILDGFALNPGDLSWECFEKYGEVHYYDRTSDDEVVSRINDAEIIFTNKTNISANVVDKCKNLKYVGVLATGYNVVDVDACKKKGIIVTNIPSYGTKAVAQFTFALILELYNQIGLHNQSVQQGEWEKSKDFCYFLKPSIELQNKTLGIVGYGKIGQEVAKIAKAFDLKVIVYNRSQKIDNTNYCDLNKLLENSDIISLNCPLTSENKHMINKKSIKLMKKSAILINTARGGLVNEIDLAKALNDGEIAGAGVDVLENEPPVNGSPLINAKNCIITPHIAWSAKESRTRLLAIAEDNLKCFLENKPKNTIG